MLHRIRHRLGWNVGTVVSATDRYGFVWIGFKCAGCGRIDGIHIAPYTAPRPPALACFS